MKLPNKIEPLVPKHEGMRVLEMGYIPMDKIHSSKNWTNWNRPEGPDAKKIAEHEKSIREGKYIPEIHIPPTLVKTIVDGEVVYELVTGCHRHVGHENTGQTDFYGAVVEFFDTKKGDANYHRTIWQSNENAENADNTVSKNVRSDAGIIQTTLKVMDDGHVSRDEAGIIRALTDQYIDKNSQKGKNLKNEILSMIDKNAETVRILSKTDVAELEREESTPSVHAIARTMKDYSGIDTDYDVRLMMTILSFLNSGKSKRWMRVFLHWTGLNASQIRSARIVKSGLFDRLAEMCRQYLHFYDNGELQRRVDVVFTDQLKSDIEFDSYEDVKQAA